MNIDYDDINFTFSYRAYVENWVEKRLQKDDYIIFKGWIDYFYLVIVDNKSHLTFIFGNNREKEKFYTLPFHLNKSNYYCFFLYNLKNFPKDFLKAIKKRGLVFNNIYKPTQETTLQRLIASCKFNIKGSHVHHIDGNTKNNSSENLLPIDPQLHQLYHTEKSPQNFLLILDNSKKIFISQKNNYSRYKNDYVILLVCLWRYLSGRKIQEIANMKAIKPISIATIKRILKQFSGFKFYYDDFRR